MRIAEIILAVLALAALLLHRMLSSGGVWLSMVFLGALSVFYLSFAVPLFNRVSIAMLLNRSKSGEAYPSAIRIVWAAIAGIIFALVLCGILFAVNGWYLAPFFWTAGMLLLVPVGAVSLSKNMLQSSSYHKAIALRTGILLLCGILVVVLQQ